MDARHLTLALFGTWHGRRGLAPCPICQPERRRDQRGLSIRDHQSGTGFVLYCFKGGCEFQALQDTLRALGLIAGHSPYAGLAGPALAKPQVSDEHAALRRAAKARSWWREARPIQGTPAETYLFSRGITCAHTLALRFHPACPHPDPDIHQHLPAMLARVDGADHFALHRTFLRPDGRGKADVMPNKAMLGRVTGGAARLLMVAPDGDAPLVVAEGIETALSVACLLAVPVTLWATLSAYGMRAVRLPSGVGRLIVASDGEPVGRGAADALALRALAQGWAVELLPAPDGRDWNDVLVVRRGLA